MIKTYADKLTYRFCSGERVKEFQGIKDQAERRLIILNDATCIEDLIQLRSNRFEALHCDRDGQFSIRINEKFRICFIWKEDGAHHVEITDYH